MADKVKVGDVVKVKELNPSYWGKFKRNDIAVVTQTHLSGDGWMNLGDEEGAPFWIAPYSVEVLQPIDLDGGDNLVVGQTLVALDDVVTDLNRRWFTKGKAYTVVDRGDELGVVDDEGDPNSLWNDFPPMALLSEAPTTTTSTQPPMFKDMSDELRGLLLLDKHEGKIIQFYNPLSGAWEDDDPVEEIDPNMAYRTKPEALIELEVKVKDTETLAKELKQQLVEMQASL